MNKCPTCGGPVSEDSKICTTCGALLNEESVPTQQTTENTAANAPAFSPQAVQQNPQPTSIPHAPSPNGPTPSSGQQPMAAPQTDPQPSVPPAAPYSHPPAYQQPSQPAPGYQTPYPNAQQPAPGYQAPSSNPQQQTPGYQPPYQNQQPPFNPYGVPGRPPFMQPPGDPSKNGLAVASLVMGILGMCFMFGGFIFDILGIIFGALSLKSQKQGFAKAGLILSIVAIALSILLFFLLILIAISEGGYYFSYDFPAPYI